MTERQHPRLADDGSIAWSKEQPAETAAGDGGHSWGFDRCFFPQRWPAGGTAPCSYPRFDHDKAEGDHPFTEAPQPAVACECGGAEKYHLDKPVGRRQQRCVHRSGCACPGYRQPAVAGEHPDGDYCHMLGCGKKFMFKPLICPDHGKRGYRQPESVADDRIMAMVKEGHAAWESRALAAEARLATAMGFIEDAKKIKPDRAPCPPWVTTGLAALLEGEG